MTERRKNVKYRKRINIEQEIQRSEFENDEYEKYKYEKRKREREREERDCKVRSTVALEAKLKEFKSFKRPEPFVFDCLQNTVIDEITCNSSVIAGAAVRRVQMRRYLKGFDLDQADPDYIKELFAQRNATSFAFTSAMEGVPLTVEFIKELHRIIIGDFGRNGGKFRTSQVKIPGCPKAPSPPENIEKDLEGLLGSRLLNDIDIPIWQRVEQFHLEFEDIHPFESGNGRVGFLLIAYQLIREGYPPAEIFFQDCVEYYRAFDAYYLKSNDIPMINFFIDIIERAVDRYLDVYRRYEENMAVSKKLNRRKCRKVASR